MVDEGASGDGQHVERVRIASDVARWMRGTEPAQAHAAAEDIAEMVAYLASDRAKNMTGGSYHWTGGIVA